MKVDRYIAVYLLLVIMIFGCTKQKDYSEVENLLKRWADSTRFLNYSEYTKLEANPKDINTFNAIYKNYYVANIKIVRVDEKIRNGTDIDGQPYEYKNVTFIASVYNRDTNQDQIVNGDIKLIRYVSGKKKDKGWLLSNRTMIYQQ